MAAGDRVYFVDWRGDPDEKLNEDGATLVDVLVAALGRGVDVRGLLWRSHWRKIGFHSERAFRLGKQIEAAGGQCLRDMRVRTLGSHHQKFVVLRHRDGYAVGDVVSYPVPAGGPGAGSLVIHRVVAGDGDGLTTQGDNRDRPDDWRPTAEAVRGSLWWHVPGGGLLLVRLLQPPVVAALAGGAFTTWILLRRPTPGRPPGTKRKRFFARHVSGRIDPALTGRDARSSGRVQGPARTGSARPAGLEQGPGRQARGTPARAGHRG